MLRGFQQRAAAALQQIDACRVLSKEPVDPLSAEKLGGLSLEKDLCYRLRFEDRVRSDGLSAGGNRYAEATPSGRHYPSRELGIPELQ